MKVDAPLSGKPRDPAYGWVIVFVAAIAMAATLPGRTHGLGLITKHLLVDFPNLTEPDFARINLWATLIGAVFCFPCGWLLDRFGIRLVLTGVLASLAAVVVWMAAVRDVPSLIVAITLTRGIGQSMLSVVSITMIGKWFRRNLGAAMGVFSVQMSLLMAVGTGLLSEYINAPGIDWRSGWLLVGIVLAAVTPACALLACNPRKSGDATAKTSVDSNEPSATLWQALRSPCFWVFALSISFFGLVSSGISLWQQLILEERGLAADVFRNVLIIGLLVGMVTNLIAGGLAYVVRLSHLLAAAMFVLAAAYVMLPLARTPLAAYGFAVVQGIGGGLLTVLFFAVWRHAFGPAHLGQIQGTAQMLTVLASAVGPLLVAESKHAAGQYDQVLFWFAAIASGFAVIAAFTPVPSARLGVWQEPAAAESSHVTQESLA